MTLPGYASYAVVPLHLLAGLLFALIPASPYQAGYYAVYGGIVVLLVVTATVYGWQLRAQPPGFGTLWLQALLTALAIALPFFAVDFSDPWHAILYLPIMTASLVVCLVIGHVVTIAARP